MSDTAQCPDCRDQIRFKRPPQLEQRVQCPMCRAWLEVINLAPVELDWAADAILFSENDEILDPHDECLP